ncbi:uncharacterized protein LOC117373805 [Periophthalmus magnuspinnatus]|uniref:uncharacterized protein LOC117373805 n=1 Tax=Periophthalmus magnuspinnatus TaxID=409849 RepID=UPI002436DCF9|nr:uncharacterized protein LOC117373805 [Periophthalmus magnuspinnatus]
MGCRLSVSRGRNRSKPRPLQRSHGPEELHFRDEFGQPITVQLEERGRGQYRPIEAHWEMGQTQRPCYGEPYIPPDLYPYMSHDQFPTASCVPSVSYSLDQMDQVDPEWLQTQFACPWPPPDLRPDPTLDLDQGQSGPGLVPNFPCNSSQFLKGMLLSEAETDIVSSLPGHTPSSRGSSPSDSLTSSLTSEPSDSGFHSVSTAGPAPRAVGPSPGHHRPHLQRGRWELQSIPENWSPAPHYTHQHSDPRGFWEMQSIPESGSRASCSVGNSTTTTVHFHRPERSPTSPRQHSPRLQRQRSPAATPLGCRTEPCQRRALWLQDGSRTLTEPNRSQTFTNLSQNQNQHRRRASHPCTLQASETRTSQSIPSETRSNQISTAPRRSLSRTSQWDRSLTHDRQPSLNQDQNQDFNQIAQNSSTYTPQPITTRSRESLDQVFTKVNRTRDLSLDQNPHSPLTRTSQTLKTRSNRESTPQFYSTVQSSPRSPNQRPLRRHRAPRLVHQRSDVTTDEELFPPPQDRRRPGHKTRIRSSQSRSGPDQDPLMVLRDQNLDRIRTRQILDEWTTIEELLSHGTRTENRSKGWPSPLLSVTTV